MNVLHCIELEAAVRIKVEELLVGHLVVLEFNCAVDATRVTFNEAMHVVELQHLSPRGQDDVGD